MAGDNQNSEATGATDDYYANYYKSFENYVPTSVDPGMSMLWVTGLYCCITMMLVPFLVAYGRRYHARKMALENLTNDDEKNVQDAMPGDYHSDDDFHTSMPSKKFSGRARTDLNTQFDINGSFTLSDAVAGKKPPSEYSTQSDATMTRGSLLRWSHSRRSRQASRRDPNTRGGRNGPSTRKGRRSSRRNPYEQRMSFRDALCVTRRATRRGAAHYSKPALNVLEDDWQWDKIADDEDEADRDAGYGPERFDADVTGSVWGRSSVASSSRRSMWDARTSPAMTRSTRMIYGRDTNTDKAIRAALDMDSIREDSTKAPSSDGRSEHTHMMPILDECEDENDGLGPINWFCGEGAVYGWTAISEGIEYVLFLSSIDNETKRLFQLAVPMTLSLISGALFDIVDTLIIAQFMGLNALAAYTIVEAFLGISDCFFAGLVDTVGTLAAFAIGNENYHLAGQYVQITSVMYVVCSIPVILFWLSLTDTIVEFLGCPVYVAEAAQLIASWLNWSYLISGVHCAFTGLLDVSGHETFGAIMDFIFCIIDSFALYIALKFFQADWFELGIMWITLEVIQAIVTFIIAYKKGWLDKYMDGMCYSFALKNTAAVKYVVETAIPLSIGEFLAYGEWEVMVVLITSIGSAELAVWGMISTVWELLEAATNGVSDAASIRVSLHLGRGLPALAKLSAHKALYFSVLLAFFTTSVLYIVAGSIPAWFTDHAVIQNMIYETLPLIGLGNIFLVYGMTAWGVVGGQGRFYLSTITLCFCGWGVTLPYCSVVTYLLNYNLEGIVSGVVLGYATAAVGMSYVVLTSDWNFISEEIIRKNKLAAEEESESESDSEYSSESESESDKLPGIYTLQVS